MKICECGCGKEVAKPTHRFLHGHNRPFPTKTDDEVREQIRLLVRIAPSGCWEWTGERNKRRDGSLSYGRITYKGRYLLTHRVSYLLFRGEIPNGMHVCHTCDNPACVRPDHLFLGTHADNMRDRDAKGRVKVTSGESHYLRKRPRYSEDSFRARLTYAIAQSIRERLARGERGADLARELGVSRSTIHDIKTGKTYTIPPAASSE